MFQLGIILWKSSTPVKVVSLRTLCSSGLCRGIAQLLILLMVGQALPLVEIGHTYRRALPAVLKTLFERVPSWWSSPADGSFVTDPAQNLIGRVNEPATLTVDGAPVSVAQSGAFNHGPLIRV